MNARTVQALVAALLLMFAVGVTSAGAAGTISVPRGYQPDAAKVASPITHVIGPVPLTVPFVEVTVGTGACGTPDHAPAARVPLAGLNDLYLCTSWLPLAGVHLQSIDLFSPGGDFYQKIETPFETPAVPARYMRGGTAARKVTLEGRRIPVEVKKASQDPVTGLHGLQAAIAVAGSYIALQSMTGTWTYHVHLDYSDTPIATGTVEITN